MKKYHLTNKALEDLEEIWSYTNDNWSESRADAYYRELISAIREVAKRSACLDKKYDEIFPELYCHKCRKHLVFYHLVDDGIEVVRILHERMDIYSKFN